ncbi:MAG: ABC transporter ATP-binding protein [Metamycoplasmataceae bacterium]
MNLKNELNEKNEELLLNVKNLVVSFKKNSKKIIRIVRGVDFKIKPGQIIGLVGESGSGKSVTSKSLLNINFNSITSADKMEIDGFNLLNISEKEWKKIRGKKIGYIPQDPLTSLNPTRTVGNQLLDVLTHDERFSSLEEKKNYLIDLLEKFGIRNAKEKFDSYPHTFSGGMKQRIVIALVVAARPKLIIADEPTTALDPTVQASVLSLFNKIRNEYNISIIFISHNISVIAKFCDFVYIMYAGKIVEKGTRKDIFTNPLHPYTWALISSIPNDKNEKLVNIQGTPADMQNLPSGDPFASRNEYALEIDFKKEPPLFKVSNTHSAATWLLEPRAPKIEKNPELIKRIKLFQEVFKDE